MGSQRKITHFLFGFIKNYLYLCQYLYKIKLHNYEVQDFLFTFEYLSIN